MAKFGQYQKLFWAKGPNFGGEVIVFVQCVLNCWPLRLWFPELSKTPYMSGGNFRTLSLLGSPGFVSENWTAPSWQVTTFTVIIFWKYSQLLTGNSVHFLTSYRSHQVSVGQWLGTKLKYKLCVDSGCIWQWRSVIKEVKKIYRDMCW